MNREQWNSTFIFIISAIGSAVGLGNIWRFPYIMGQYGGAVFLFIYLFFILFFCSVPLICEISFGKYAKKENVGAYSLINPKFKVFGWINFITAICVSSFYIVVGGWIINYLLISLLNIKIIDQTSYFNSFISNPISSYLYTFIFLLICVYVVYRGVNKGIGLANKIMMPIFFIILIILCIFSISLPNASKGLEFMFKPDISKINFNMIIAALGQSFFTLSVGMGALLVYGSYMNKKDNPVKCAYTIIVSDTIFALLAGIMIFPAVFSFGLESNSGAGLVFVTLPQIFSQMHYGYIISILFFILLLFAAITSEISIVEVQVVSIMENFKFTRLKSVIIVSILLVLITIPTALSFGVLKNVTIFSKTFFDIFDYISANVLLPFGSLIMCIVLGWFAKGRMIFRFRNRIFHIIFLIMVRYIVPLVLLCLIFGQFITNK